MKYHTLSTSSLAAEGKKSTLTIYTGPDFVRDKMDSTETAIVRLELEMAQRALKLQTRRCRQLVSEFTRKLQAKDLELISERHLRDQQLTRVLRSLLVFEARLKQEQTFIRHQLADKDDVISHQRKELHRLRDTVQFCNTCSQYYNTQPANTNSNCDSCDSNWETSSVHSSGEDTYHLDGKVIYEKNKYNKSNKRCKKTNNHRRMTGTYFEVLKSRESSTESSAEDASSDLSESQKTKEEIERVSERIEELFAENIHSSNTFSDKMDSLHGIRKNISPDSTLIEVENISASEIIDNQSIQSTTLFNDLSNCQEKEENKQDIVDVNSINDNLENEEKELSQVESNTSINRLLISETISVFDAGEGEQHNDNWYASASDPEDDEQRDMYRNNPVLECMNQILLQNINDSINSPPKSPELDRNLKNKSQKRVKFSDESNDASLTTSTETNVKIDDAVENSCRTEIKEPSLQADYYETPIQGGANFYEVPHSIYSNDYEQILSKCGDSVHSWSSSTKMSSPTSKLENLQENKINRMATQKLTLAKCSNLDELENKSHYYIDMDTSTPVHKHEIVKKTKVSRTPPALPPKPANLVSKFKIQSTLLNRSDDNLEDFTVDSEPDYCSISELNLPTEKMIMSKSHCVSQISDTNLNQSNVSLYDPISLDGTLTSLVAQNVEKNSFQAPKQPQIKNERIVANMASIAQINMLKNKNEPEIPKLPQVSEIIIPEETEEKKKVEHISQDNYIKNNSQLLKQKVAHGNDKLRNRIMIGTSVSSLVSSFNNQHILSQIGNRNITAERYKVNNKLFSNFEYPQDYEKQSNVVEKPKNETPSFEKFDLSQNFEEFNLDDCEIGEEYQSETSNSLNYNVNLNDNAPQPDVIKEATSTDNFIEQVENLVPEKKSNTSVEIVRATKDVRPHSLQSLQQLQKSLSSQRNNNIVRENDFTNAPQVSRNPEPSYEHFLECTGLSSKSILTPSRMLSNHKSMLKPKDIKLRSRVKSTAVFEHPSGTVKYWSEPYL